MWTSLCRYRSTADIMQYTLQEDDTLWTIAKKFNVSALSIIKANPHLNPFDIFPDQTIQIPVVYK